MKDEKTLGAAMRLPAIEIPETTDEKARQWAYRLGTLPFHASVDDVAMLISAARAEAVAEYLAATGNQAAPSESGSVPSEAQE